MTSPREPGSSSPRTTYIFWQPEFSLRDAALISRMARDPGHRVILVAMCAKPSEVLLHRGSGEFGAAEVILAPTETQVLELAGVAASGAVHLVEGVHHPIWDNHAVVQRWIRERPRLLLIDDGWVGDGADGRRHIRNLRVLARLGGKLIGAVLVTGNYSVHQFERCGFAEVFPFTHFTMLAETPSLEAGEPAQLRQSQVGSRPVPVASRRSRARTSSSSHDQGSHALSLRTLGPGLESSGVNANPEISAAHASWTAQHISSVAAAAYLASIIRYLDESEAERPSSPWQITTKVRYRRVR